MSKVKKFLREKIIPYNIYVRMSKTYNTLRNKKSKKDFSRSGIKTLLQTCETLDKTGFKYFVAFGTLLGLFRDGKLLSNDMDIDVLIYAKGKSDIQNIRRTFEWNEFKRVLTFDVRGIGCIQDSFVLNNVKVDATYVFEENNCDKVYLLYGEACDKALFFSFTKVENTIKKELSNVLVTIPEDTEQFLKDIYGENWRISDPDYEFWKNPLITKIYNPGEIKHL